MLQPVTMNLNCSVEQSDVVSTDFGRISSAFHRMDGTLAQPVFFTFTDLDAFEPDVFSQLKKARRRLIQFKCSITFSPTYIPSNRGSISAPFRRSKISDIAEVDIFQSLPALQAPLSHQYGEGSSAFSMNKPLGGTGLTGELLEQAFVAAGKASPGCLESVSAEKIVHSGGNMSDILRVFLTWKRPVENKVLPDRMLVKMPKKSRIDEVTAKMDPKLAEQFKEAFQMDEITRVECTMYLMLSKQGPGIPIPKCYATWTEGENSMMFLAIEDLSPHARTPEFSDGLTKGQLMNCAEAIAALQAWSLNTEYEWKKQLPGPLKYVSGFLGLLGSVGEELEKSVKKYPDHLACVNKEKVCSVLSDKERIIAAMGEYRNLLPDVLVHGDFWVNNLLFQVDKETSSISDRLAAIIDWQMCHQGSFVEDLCRLYAFSVDPEVRRSTMKDVFRQYFDKMQLLAPKTMQSVSFDSAYHVFEKAVFFFGLMMVVPASRFSEFMLHRDRTMEAAMIRRVGENYKDAAKFFNF